MTTSSTPRPCPECGGDLHFFEPQAAQRSVDPASLPSACRQCHGIFLHGARLVLPAEFEKKAVSLAIQADKAAKATRAEMEADPALRVERYLSETYRTAYMTGFFRAMAYFQHQAKGGRLIRLSRLWASFKKWRHASSQMVEISVTDYHEFDKLLQVRTTRENGHGEGAANGSATGRDGNPPLPGSTGKSGGGKGPVE